MDPRLYPSANEPIPGGLFLTLDIADLGADATYYMVVPFKAKVTKIWSVIDGTVSTADATITARVGSTAMTGGQITITQSGSAAGDVDAATPTAGNALLAGEAINFVVAGGGTAGPRCHLVVQLERN